MGFVARYLDDGYDMEVFGVDVDPEQVRLAHEHSDKHAGLHFAAADATQLPFEDDYFDLVLSFMVVHHVGDLKRSIAEVSRVLKPGGTFIFYEITYPGYMVKTFKAFANKFGIFTREELMEYLGIENYQVLYEEGGKHLVFKIISLVMRKG